MIKKKSQDKYLIQLIEHPILQIPNILFAYFLSIFSRKKFSINIKICTPKNANITCYNEKKKHYVAP